MEEDEKKDYRLHLINTIDNAIDNGISVYDLNVVNKKAIRHNYINKQALIDTINENGFEVYTKEYGNIEVVSIDVLQELLEGEANERNN